MTTSVPDARRSDMLDFDLIKEGFVSLLIMVILILVVAAFAKAPYRPPVTNRQVAMSDPMLFTNTTLGYLDGTESIASYGPPYNNGFQGQQGGVQSIGSFAPQTWWGIPYPINTIQDFVLRPLSQVAQASQNQTLDAAISAYQSTPVNQQIAWVSNYRNALSHAAVSSGQVIVPPGNYGPLAVIIPAQLRLAQSGLLSGALNQETNQGPYRFNVQNDLLYIQGDALHNVASSINMLGEQWGINHDEEAYPGPWWLTPYTFLYQVPPWSTLPAGDMLAAYTIAILVIILIFVPWIPGLNRLPRVLRVYRLIWRDWYKR